MIIVDNAGDTITLAGVHAADLHPSDFISLIQPQHKPMPTNWQ